ncbi:hypothetical protein GIB67_002533 [Kingdonia uniflora]|uniref:Uncharacterized protein n=1 Tax=Kingdonia uniflora TaxID=39325 RepID=A0A7J7N9F9_9MAGN|nr:hypothetical protein GIB67_002533 [Kingdonia uniflora]
MHSKNLKPSSNFVVSASSKESSSSDRTMDDSVVIGAVTADNPSVSSRRDVGLHAGDETGEFFKYPENADISKKFLQYKKSLDGEWGNYVMNIGLWFRTLVRPSGNVEHYQVPSLDCWKRSMDIGNDIDIVYYNKTGSEVVEEGFLCYLNQVAYGLSIPLTFFQKWVMNALKSFPGQLNGNINEMMRVYEVLNHKWKDGGIARQFIVDDVMKYYKFKYVKDQKSGYFFSDSARPKFFEFESSGRPWFDHLVMFVDILAEPNPKAVADTSSLFDVVSREGSELNKALGELGTRREKRLNSVVEKLFVAWKSVAEVLKLATANRGKLDRRHDAEKAALQDQLEQEKVLQREQFEKEKVLQREVFEKEAASTKQEVEDEVKKVVDIAVASQNKLIQAFYFWGLSREDVNFAIAGKYGEIVFPGDDASLVAEQTLAPSVADDSTKEIS